MGRARGHQVAVAADFDAVLGSRRGARAATSGEQLEGALTRIRRGADVQDALSALAELDRAGWKRPAAAALLREAAARLAPASDVETEAYALALDAASVRGSRSSLLVALNKGYGQAHLWPDGLTHVHGDEGTEQSKTACGKSVERMQYAPRAPGDICAKCRAKADELGLADAYETHAQARHPLGEQRASAFVDAAADRVAVGLRPLLRRGVDELAVLQDAAREQRRRAAADVLAQELHARAAWAVRAAGFGPGARALREAQRRGVDLGSVLTLASWRRLAEAHLAEAETMRAGWLRPAKPTADPLRAGAVRDLHLSWADRVERAMLRALNNS